MTGYCAKCAHWQTLDANDYCHDCYGEWASTLPPALPYEDDND